MSFPSRRLKPYLPSETICRLRSESLIFQEDSRFSGSRKEAEQHSRKLDDFRSQPRRNHSWQITKRKKSAR